VVTIKGKWVYLYRVVDKFGYTVDFMLSKHRHEAAVAVAFYKQAIDANGFPQKVAMDKSGDLRQNHLESSTLSLVKPGYR
jgi:putative transposase